jgi:predicted double-glycine peptidase
MRRVELCLVCSCLLLGGCSSVAPFRGLALDAGGTYVPGVTPVRQDENHGCGAACVATVTTHWGVNLDEFRTRSRPAPKNATGLDLQAMAEELGLQAFAYEGSIADLEDNLGKGRPLIVMIPMPLMSRGGPVGALLFNAWNEFGRRPAHWVVVLGLLDDRHIVIHDPASGPLLVRQRQFQEWWAQMGNRCVLIARAD